MNLMNPTVIVRRMWGLSQQELWGLKNGKLPTSGRWQWRKRKITSKPDTLRNWHTYNIYCNKAIPGDKPSFVSMTLASREGVVCCV